jgi:nucleotide-binding universal stress UspA family protein
MFPIHNIVYTTDYAENSQHAFQLACALARDYQARLIVMHVVPTETAELLALSQMGTQEKTGNLRDVLRKVQPLGEPVRVEHRLEDGDPATEIVRVTREIPADLIVMATRGMTGLGRLLLGSVTEEVVRKASCPVLTVRTALPETIAVPEQAAVAVAPA